jgi:hypothetical protein
VAASLRSPYGFSASVSASWALPTWRGHPRWKPLACFLSLTAAHASEGASSTESCGECKEETQALEKKIDALPPADARLPDLLERRSPTPFSRLIGKPEDTPLSQVLKGIADRYRERMALYPEEEPEAAPRVLAYVTAPSGARAIHESASGLAGETGGLGGHLGRVAHALEQRGAVVLALGLARGLGHELRRCRHKTC